MKLLLLFLVLVTGSAGGSGTLVKKSVMPWMCLQRCNFTAADVHEHLKELILHRDVVDKVAFEQFNLGPHSALVDNKNLIEVAPQLHTLGFKTFAMVSSFPYPPQFLDWMRQLFDAPESFIVAALSAARKYQLSGFNVDFEPTAKATASDAKRYVEFLDLFADRLHAEGLELSVAVGGWSAIWDMKLLGQSRVDKVNLMSTYTGNFTLFSEALSRAVEEIGVAKLGVGLENVNPNTKLPYSLQEMQERFRAIKGANANEIDIWDMPVPSLWWTLLDEWATSPI